MPNKSIYNGIELNMSQRQCINYVKKTYIIHKEIVSCLSYMQDFANVGFVK